MASQANRFAVIDGSREPPSPWQDLPQTVVARSPFDRERVALYRLSKATFSKLDAARRRQPFFDAWTCVLGKVPPVNNSSILTRNNENRKLHSLSDAHACFRGVKRAVGDDPHGHDLLAFISKPTWGVCFSPSMGCVVSWWPVPSDVVFVTYVRLDHPATGRYGTANARAAVVRGVITHWQFVEADLACNELPVEFQERYRRRLW
jgi:hypothetical protein